MLFATEIIKSEAFYVILYIYINIRCHALKDLFLDSNNLIFELKTSSFFVQLKENIG